MRPGTVGLQSPDFGRQEACKRSRTARRPSDVDADPLGNHQFTRPPSLDLPGAHLSKKRLPHHRGTGVIRESPTALDFGPLSRIFPVPWGRRKSVVETLSAELWEHPALRGSRCCGPIRITRCPLSLPLPAPRFAPARVSACLGVAWGAPSIPVAACFALTRLPSPRRCFPQHPPAAPRRSCRYLLPPLVLLNPHFSLFISLKAGGGLAYAPLVRFLEEQLLIIDAFNDPHNTYADAFIDAD